MFIFFYMIKSFYIKGKFTILKSCLFILKIQITIHMQTLSNFTYSITKRWTYPLTCNCKFTGKTTNWVKKRECSRKDPEVKIEQQGWRNIKEFMDLSLLDYCIMSFMLSYDMYFLRGWTLLCRACVSKCQGLKPCGFYVV